MEQEQYTPQIDECINEEEEELKEQLAEEAEEESSNPLQGIVDIYKEGVKEGNKRGFGDIFKEATENLLRYVNYTIYEKTYGWKKNETIFPEDMEWHIKDLYFGDGYFIFGRGDNSVISFRIEEIPGWLFGIWWHPIQDKAKSTEEHPVFLTDVISCEFFAQYEEDIDKFKPSYSIFGYNFRYDLNSIESNGYDFSRISDILTFLQKEPMLAWYRNMYSTDFNTEHVTREEATKAFQNYQNQKELEKRIVAENDQKMIDTVKYIFKPFFDENVAFILDQGTNCSPRFELILKNIWAERGATEFKDGCYDMFDFGLEWEDCERDEKLYDDTQEACVKYARDNNTHWWRAFNKVVVIKSEPKYSELKSKYNYEK